MLSVVVGWWLVGGGVGWLGVLLGDWCGLQGANLLEKATIL